MKRKLGCSMSLSLVCFVVTLKGVCAWLLLPPGPLFTPSQATATAFFFGPSPAATSLSKSVPCLLASDQPTSENEASKLRAQADQMRLEAERLDLSLTLRKIEALEAKVFKKKEWTERHVDQIESLDQQIQSLRTKLLGKNS